MGEVPDSLPVTDEARERLREQANQLPEATVLRLIDLLAVAVDDMRQGGDPRLPLELALVKVTRPASDLSRESLAFRLERLEAGHSAPAEKPSSRAAQSSEQAGVAAPAPAAGAEAPPAAADEAPTEPLRVELEQLQEAWLRTILPAVEQRAIWIGKTLGEARPASLAGDTLTVEFPENAAFHLRVAEDPKNAAILRDALYEVTGRKLAVAFELGETGNARPEDAAPTSEEDVLELLKSTFDAREQDE
jgi:DNA polymerase III gamma/tau subunit